MKYLVYEMGRKEDGEKGIEKGSAKSTPLPAFNSSVFKLKHIRAWFKNVIYVSEIDLEVAAFWIVTNLLDVATSFLSNRFFKKGRQQCCPFD